MIGLTLVTSAPAAAQVNGAIFTTDSSGTQVNGNIYQSQADVYLDGGPQPNAPCSAGGLPNGDYYFQVTDPSGSVLLSTDAVSQREVTVSGGLIAAYIGSPADHTIGTGKCPGSISVALAPFSDTPNQGGEYKAWMTPVGSYNICSTSGSHTTFGFCDSDSKTDNFKIHKSGQANVTVCKFNDLSDDGVRNGDALEPLIPGWPITATGVDGDPVSGLLGNTDQDGCGSFTVSTFSNKDGTQTVTLAEGLLTGFTQTAPADGTCSLAGGDSSTPNANDSCSVSGGVITLSVSPDDNVIAPSFGNAGTAPLVVSKNAYTSYKYNWGIKKSVDKTEIDTNSGGSATFNYTVSVTHDAGGGWMVAGAISVYNPNTTDVTGVTVTDAIGDGSTCTVANGSGITVPATSQVDLAYTCTYPSSQTTVPDLATNTATASWTDSSSNTQTATLSPTTFPIYSHTFTAPTATCASYKNTATTGLTGTDQSASQTVKVCGASDLTVSKDATPSFIRTYAWGIQKTATSQTVPNTGSATLNYNVKVTETGIVDSLWQVTGTITVINSNDWEDITVTITDAVNDGGSCSGGGVQVPARVPGQPVPGSATLTYTCTYTSQPAYNATATNTATAAWSGAYTPHASAWGSAGFSFTSPTSLLNQSTTVTDSFNGGTGTTLGTVWASNTLPFSYTYAYSNTIPVPASGCITVPNTGTLSTGGSTKVNVQVCRPAAKTGALTMGYWQNKNGQAIITNGASTNKACNSGTWLRHYAPFQDLSSTSTCTQVASYVYNVIKAANSSGASMNAMLKAQMLATSLDVYFSDSTLGGNKINAPAPIGGVVIDLTEVCSVSDQTNGTGTCSGTYINTSVAFGGASSMTVSGLLTYAASQSNSGGSTWHANVKSTQFLAKDTFDAINNQLAYTP
ncbi:MAG: hypothetical protein DMG21_08170 [Acidobacteria bacterium]|nr:MAG: hypothetical protein DMG21_08170 [Acidobacteriota bacterium]